MRPINAVRLSVLSIGLAACAAIPVPGFGAEADADAAASTNGAPVQAASVVVGESGLASGIPAAVQAFPDPDEARPTVTPSRLPTLLPRQLPSQDAGGTSFADTVSISPDGRRLLVGTQQGDRFGIQVVAANTKNIETQRIVRGELAFVGWSGPRTALLGYREGGRLRIDAFDLATGEVRGLSDRPGEGGVLALAPDGRAITTRPGREAFACADGQALPTDHDGTPIVQAGPPDPSGRIVFRTVPEADEGVLLPYDCDAGGFDDPIYEGAPFDGALFDTAGGGYLGVWDEAGPRYLDPSLRYEMAEVAASFPGEVAVWPIEFTRSPNTVLLYVSGAEVPPSYYVLDRYAGALDLHVGDERP